MPEYIDLSLPIRPHFRWPMERGLASDYDKGAQFQTTWIKLVVHGFTHIDSPRHMVRDGKTSSTTLAGLGKATGGWWALRMERGRWLTGKRNWTSFSDLSSEVSATRGGARCARSTLPG